MNYAPRFLIAKYIPDVKRMEPKNVGVILWNAGALVARFAGEKSNDNGVQKPRFIRSRNLPVYKNWVTYWRLQMDQKHLSLDGKEIKQKDPKFVDALQKQCKENYLLTDGGFLPRRIPKEKANDAVDQLFEELVGESVPEKDTTPSATLEKACNEFIEATGLKDSPDFHDNYEVKYTRGGVERTTKFSFGKGPGGYTDLGIKPEALFQKTRIHDEKDVNSSLFVIGAVTQSKNKIVSKKQCAALIYATEDDMSNTEVRTSFEMLCKMGFVINVADQNVWEESIHHMGVAL